MKGAAASAGFVAALVGFGGTLAVLMQAALVLGASSTQIASWISALCIAIAVSSLVLSWRYRMPIITAWSTPGLALVAATSGYRMEEAVSAFILCGLAIAATAWIKPVSLAIQRIPASISSAMLAGVLLSFVVRAMGLIGSDPAFVLPLMVLFFVVRRFHPAYAVLAVLVAGLIVAFASGNIAAVPALHISGLQWVMPKFSIAVTIGLALPLYLVTMASQNLPGFAVLRTYGFIPPVKACLSVTGLVATVSAFFGASTTNIAAISAAICTGPDAGPDPQQRWKAGVFYAVCYCVFALFGASLVALFAALPQSFIILIAGLALLGAFIGAITQALSVERERLAAIVTFTMTVSGLTLFGIGAPFWALLGGLVVYVIDNRLFGN